MKRQNVKKSWFVAIWIHCKKNVRCKRAKITFIMSNDEGKKMYMNTARTTNFILMIIIMKIHIKKDFSLVFFLFRQTFYRYILLEI